MPTTSKEEITRFLASEFPTSRCVVQSVGDGVASVSYAITSQDLRPSGTVSGPVLIAVADVALYIAVLGAIGIVPLAVTTSLNINFFAQACRRQRHRRAVQAAQSRQNSGRGGGVIAFRRV